MSATPLLLAVFGVAWMANLSFAHNIPNTALSASSPAAPALTEQPLENLPYTPVLDVHSMDRRIDPCEDFYQYSCGGWRQNNPIPSDQASWDVYTKMARDNKRVLWGILERLSQETEDRNVTQQKIGDAYAACADDAGIEAAGAKPLNRLLKLVDALRDKKDLPAALAELHLATADNGLFFELSASQDYADSTRVITFANSGGVSMPDRDYYLKNDANSRALRDAYVEHMRRMFQLLGDSESQAQHNASIVMEIESALARDSLTRSEQRNPRKLFHKVKLAGLQTLTPAFNWKPYFNGLGLGQVKIVNVTEPKFYRALNTQLRLRSLEELKVYMRWHVVHSSAPFLSSPFVNENFSFFSQTLRGVPDLAPRWRRCVALIDKQMGDGLGQEFVKITFSPELKAKTLQLTLQIEAAMERAIKDLDWMSPITKRKALEKLHSIVNKIGYPEKWRDYSSLLIRRDDLLGNVTRANEFEIRRELAKIGKPIDHGEWGMTPPTVNAYYDPQLNDINFPAGILQPPLFDSRLDDAPNYGNTGSTIGHELTHGFDDEGRQFDAFGNLRNWWTKKDAAEFEKRTQCLTEQYSKFIVIDDIHIDTRLTVGEDLADLSGLVLAMMAWQAQVATQPPSPPRDGLTPMQRFFVGMAQWACENTRPEQSRVLALTDPHSPNRYRVNGLVANFPEFEKAFSCKPGQPMAPVQRCRVW